MANCVHPAMRLSQLSMIRVLVLDLEDICVVLLFVAFAMFDFMVIIRNCIVPLTMNDF